MAGNAHSAAVVQGFGSGMTNVVLADPVGGSGKAKTLQDAITADLRLVPFIKMLDPRAIPGGASVAQGIAASSEFNKFLLAGAHILITTSWPSSSEVEIRAYEPKNGEFLFGTRYQVGSGDNAIYDVADKFCSDLLVNQIGRGDFFRATLAFSKKDGSRKQDIWAVRPNGRNLRRLTNFPGQAVSPTWSNDGRFVLFSHIDARSHALGVWDATQGRVQRIKFPGNTVIGPCFMPDNRVAVGLTDGRNPSIFLLNHVFQKDRKLESSFSIDVSPSVDSTGTKMAFTSSRLGGPQVFLKDLRTGAVSRISKNGGYNTDPSISPDGTLVAFARLTSAGHRIFVYDLVRDTETQVTFGPGNDEEPAFAPDSYFIAYMSRRGGERKIYITTRVGGEPRLINTGPGDAAFPAWGTTR